MGYDGNMPSLVVRGLVLDTSRRLLLVSHAPDSFWYTPGGHLGPDESLTECLLRELHEETGISAEPGGLILIDQVVEHEKHEHKIELYFGARTTEDLPSDWRDQDGPVQRAGFFGPDEIANLPKVFPDLVEPSFVRKLASGSLPAIPYRDVRRIS
jgi:ADP-ribose pyrophosphatase YjhB (NUDIX family)